MGAPVLQRSRPAWCHARWGLATAACVSMIVAAHAGPQPAPARLPLPPGSTQASLGSGMRLYGMPADIRVIEIPMPVAQAAPALARHLPVLSDLGVHPGFAILSGQSAGQLWLAVLEPAGPQRARGSIAVLNAPARHEALLRAKPTWLPAGAHLHLDFSDADHGARTIHQVWTMALPRAAAAGVIAERLRQDGWHPDPSHDAASRWMRGAASLDIVIVAVDGGSGILLQQHEKVRP